MIPAGPEVRMIRGGIAEFRQDSTTGQVTITGCPIVYNAPYTVHDMFGEFTERMNPSVGADVRQFDVRLLENHAGLPYARTKPAGGKPATLFLEHDPSAGLQMRAVLDGNAPRVKDLLSSVERGDTGEMSCGFIVGHDQWNEDMTDREIFRFKELLDVSIVTFPASPTTSVEIVQRQFEAWYRQSNPLDVARARKILMLTRAGKVLSGENQDHVMNIAKAAHALLIANGFDPADLLDGGPDDMQNQDGSDGGNVGAGNQAGGSVDNPDGSGVVRAERLEQARILRARVLKAGVGTDAA